MTMWLLRADDVLRHRRWAADHQRPWSTLGTLAAIVVAFGMSYGAVMGSYGGLSPDRLPQMAYSAAKVPLLLCATFGLSLPSFYVLNMLMGLGHDFRAAVRALAATQAGVTMILASLSPYTVLWYLSVNSYPSAVLFNAVMFGVASLAGQMLLRQYYRPLIQRNRKHRWALWSWILLYALVGIQMGWILRPFIGVPDVAPAFIRSGPWTNAYVVVARLVWQAFAP